MYHLNETGLDDDTNVNAVHLANEVHEDASWN